MDRRVWTDTMALMRRKIGILLSATFCLGLMNLTDAKPYSNDQGKYSLSLPDDWAVEVATANQFSAASPDKKKRVVVNIIPLPKNDPWTDKDNKAYEAGLVKDGWSIQSRSQSKVDDVPVYVTTETATDDGTVISMESFGGIANSSFYSVGIVNRDGDPAKDSQLAAILASFHFTNRK